MPKYYEYHIIDYLNFQFFILIVWKDRYIKKQPYGMCCLAMKIKCSRSQSALYTEIFHGGVGLWHENINASFVECFNLECFDEKEITTL